jgi:hypothetical protein
MKTSFITKLISACFLFTYTALHAGTNTNALLLGVSGKLSQAYVKEISSFVSPFGSSITIDPLGLKPQTQATLFAGLTHLFSEKFEVTATVFSDLNSIKRLETSTPDSTSSIKIRNQWGIAIAPGLIFENNKEAYLRFGYASARFSRTASSAISPSLAQTLPGALFGLGGRVPLKKQLLVAVDLNYFTYKETDNRQGAPIPGDNGIISARWQPILTSASISLIYKIG